MWYLLADLNVEALERAIAAWAKAWRQEGALSVDGKSLRGSKREGLPALQVVTAASQVIGVVLEQRGVEKGEMVTAAIALLKGLLLEGEVGQS
ncbi:MAG: hypothetical protein D6759_19750 [Chloroflexi bacterium]|nr:MAG: hypothetical protein D6759_19750 [Chloroflexota bacterium]